MGNLTFFPEAASEISHEVDALMLYVLGVAIFFSVLISTLIVYFSIKYRFPTSADRSKPVSSNILLEIVWTGIPLLLALTMFAWGSRLFIRMHEPPPDAMDIYVIGKQWMWKMQHPGGQREINELHVPIGRSVRLRMTSQDVIHSFFVPAFRLKQDVLPGRTTFAWFAATRAGRYHLFCSQYCGTSHSAMVGWVEAMPPADYQRWLSDNAGRTRGTP